MIAQPDVSYSRPAVRFVTYFATHTQCVTAHQTVQLTCSYKPRRADSASLQRKAVELGQKANVFAAVVYWNPTHQQFDAAVHIPRGQTLPSGEDVRITPAWPFLISHFFAGRAGN